MTFYTYLHRRESDNQPFYIGKGLVKSRRAFSPHGRNKHWKHTVAKHGLKVEICAEWATEAEALEHEKFLILCFKDMGVSLCNMTDGGEGTSGHKLSVEHRAKLTAANTGRKLSEEHKAVLLESRKHLKGQALSPEHKEKLRAVGKTRKFSDEHRAKISAANTGRKLSDEHKTKLSVAGKGRKLSAEHKAKIGAASTGRKMSDEHRAKLTALVTGQPLSKEHKEKISVANTGRKHSEEVKAKQSAAAKQRWAAKKALTQTNESLKKETV
jgi:hypothetical protein